jgi:predicted Rossmann fold flavoprotein
MKKNIAIIGAGASGIMTAIISSKNKNLNIDIYEKESLIARKVLASGNGKCNITNTNLSSDDYFGENPNFIKYLLGNFDFNKCKNIFEDLGVLFDISDDRRVFPLSCEAKGLLHILNTHLKKDNINLLLDTTVIDIQKNNSKYKIVLENSSKNYDVVVICSGSNSYKKLGGNDYGLSFAKSLDYKFNDFQPMLVQLNLKGELYNYANGVRKNVKIKLISNKKPKEEILGDVLFTNYGISGLAILDLTVYLKKYDINNLQLSINLLPQFNFQELSNIIEKLQSKNNFDIYTTLCGILHSKIVIMILKSLNINKEEKSLNKKLIKNIANKILDFRFDIDSTRGFEYSEVSCGGIYVSQIDNKTFESTKDKNLYFCGEVLDITGRRGGFNLHFAWGSGYMVGREISK